MIQVAAMAAPGATSNAKTAAGRRHPFSRPIRPKAIEATSASPAAPSTTDPADRPETPTADRARNTAAAARTAAPSRGAQPAGNCRAFNPTTIASKAVAAATHQSAGTAG